MDSRSTCDTPFKERKRLMASTSSLSEKPLTRTPSLTSLLVVGSWDGLMIDVATQPPGCLDVHYCDEQGSARVLAVKHQVQWMICGLGLGDQEMGRTVSGVRAVHPSVRIAVLGEPEDWRRCEVWLRRGCQVYLDAGSTFSRIASALMHAQTHDLTIIGNVFQRLQAVRRSAGVPELTPREFDVLERLRQGLMNREIAEIFHITENTVEYHMKNLLQKLGARNRLEVIERASSLGI
ncbi:MAG: hypothetical protein DI611_15740 [Brachybacterium faecium]|nr:MAG: hypothetical protein DI611_15740 [Brachybacterium faecium]